MWQYFHALKAVFATKLVMVFLSILWLLLATNGSLSIFCSFRFFVALLRGENAKPQTQVNRELKIYYDCLRYEHFPCYMHRGAP